MGVPMWPGGRRRRQGTPLPEAGSVSIVTAATMALAMMLTMVSVDLLRALEAKGRAETAADSAALAAAQEIALPTGLSPVEVAAGYAERNGATLVSCTCEPHTTEAIAEVKVSASLSFLGGDRIVTARARAVIEPAGPNGTTGPGRHDPAGRVGRPR